MTGLLSILNKNYSDVHLMYEVEMVPQNKTGRTEVKLFETSEVLMEDIFTNYAGYSIKVKTLINGQVISQSEVKEIEKAHKNPNAQDYHDDKIEVSDEIELMTILIPSNEENVLTHRGF